MDDILVPKQTWKKSKKPILKMTFGRARLASELVGISMADVSKSHASKVKEGAWHWKHSSAKARKVPGQRTVPLALTKSKKIPTLFLDIDEFLPKGSNDPALGPTRMGHEITKVLKGREKCCQWRHQENGIQYVCNNSWISSTEKTCMYHVKHCLLNKPGDHKPGEKLKVVLPNKYGLCDRHYLARFHRMPPELRIGVPGVMEQNSERMSAVARVTNGLKTGPMLDERTLPEKERKQKTKGNYQIHPNRKHKTLIRKKKKKKTRKKNKKDLPACSWNDTNDLGWRYTCTNLCTTQKQTGAVLPLCSYHIKVCRIDNPWIPICNKIHYPNELGLCRDHFLAHNNGHEPDPTLTKFNVPGARSLDHTVTDPFLPNLHPYAPKTEPYVSQERRLHLNKVMNRPPDPLTGCCHGPCMTTIKKGVFFRSHHWYKSKFQKNHYAIPPQKIVRGFIVRNRIKRRLIVLQQQKRDVACRPIQRLIRGHLGRIRYERHYYHFYSNGFPIIQKWFRGCIARAYVSLLRATLCVQQAWRRHEAMTFFRGMQLKARLMTSISQIEEDNEDLRKKSIVLIYKKFMARRIEKCMYNYLVRKRLRLDNISALFIQSVYRGHVDRVYVHAWRKNANQNANHIQRVWRGKIGREDAQRYKAALFLIVKECQRIVRGVQGRGRRDKEIEQMEKAWQFINPSMPRIAFHRFMARNNPYKKYNKYNLNSPELLELPKKMHQWTKYLTDQEKEDLRDVLVLNINKESKEFMNRMLIHKMYWNNEEKRILQKQQQHEELKKHQQQQEKEKKEKEQEEEYREHPLYHIQSKQLLNNQISSTFPTRPNSSQALRTILSKGFGTNHHPRTKKGKKESYRNKQLFSNVPGVSNVYVSKKDIEMKYNGEYEDEDDDEEEEDRRKNKSRRNSSRSRSRSRGRSRNSSRSRSNSQDRTMSRGSSMGNSQWSTTTSSNGPMSTNSIRSSSSLLDGSFALPNRRASTSTLPPRSSSSSSSSSAGQRKHIENRPNTTDGSTGGRNRAHRNGNIVRCQTSSSIGSDRSDQSHHPSYQSRPGTTNSMRHHEYYDQEENPGGLGDTREDEKEELEWNIPISSFHGAIESSDGKCNRQGDSIREFEFWPFDSTESTSAVADVATDAAPDAAPISEYNNSSVSISSELPNERMTLRPSFNKKKNLQTNKRSTSSPGRPRRRRTPQEKRRHNKYIHQYSTTSVTQEDNRRMLLHEPPSNYSTLAPSSSTPSFSGSAVSTLLTHSQGIVYLDLLLRLNDATVNISKSTESMIAFIFESWLWMDTLWKYLINDLKTGSVSTIVSFSYFLFWSCFTDHCIRLY